MVRQEKQLNKKCSFNLCSYFFICFFFFFKYKLTSRLTSLCFCGFCSGGRAGGQRGDGGPGGVLLGRAGPAGPGLRREARLDLQQ